MTDPTEITTTIAITDEMLDGMIRRALRHSRYDHDADEYVEEPMDIKKLIDTRLAKMLDKSIGEVAINTTRFVVDARIERVLDEGFPVHNNWGGLEGTKTLAQIVGEAVFATDVHNDGLKQRVHGAMRSAVSNEVSKHIASISGDVGDSMKEAAAEALGKWMKRTLKVSGT